MARLSRFFKTEIYDHYLTENEPSKTAVLQIAQDEKGRVWIVTKYNGLLQYDPKTNSFTRLVHNPDKRWTISNSGLFSVFRSREGIVWAGWWRR